MTRLEQLINNLDYMIWQHDSKCVKRFLVVSKNGYEVKYSSAEEAALDLEILASGLRTVANTNQTYEGYKVEHLYYAIADKKRRGKYAK